MKLHAPEFDEELGCIVINEHKGHDIINMNTKIITKLYPDEFKTSQYGEFDVIRDLSFIDDDKIKTIMRQL